MGTIVVVGCEGTFLSQINHQLMLVDHYHHFHNNRPFGKFLFRHFVWSMTPWPIVMKMAVICYLYSFLFPRVRRSIIGTLCILLGISSHQISPLMDQYYYNKICRVQFLFFILFFILNLWINMQEVSLLRCKGGNDPPVYCMDHRVQTILAAG